MSSNVVVARHTVSYFPGFVWTGVLRDDNTVGIILWTRVQSSDHHSSHVVDQCVDTTWSSIDNFTQIIEASFLCRDECIATQSITEL